MSEKFIDRKTVAFYVALMGLVILDLILMLWILDPITSVGTSAYASQKPVVSDATKPSPFDVAEAKHQPVQPVRRRRASASQ